MFRLRLRFPTCLFAVPTATATLAPLLPTAATVACTAATALPVPTADTEATAGMEPLLAHDPRKQFPDPCVPV